MQTKITKAVFPVAGIGTRFLPATKANPKEMLPIVDKPLIQYAVEEAVAAGFKELIFVTSSNKRAIENHFDKHYELEDRLQRDNKEDLLQIVKNIIPAGVQCLYTRQSQPLGLGHAIACTKSIVGNEAFAVLLADDLIDAQPKTCLQQMLEQYFIIQNSIVAVEKIAPEQSKNYGIVDVQDDTAAMQKVHAIIEKPLPAEAPSNLGVVGRYILTPEIFSCLEVTGKGSGGEIQLTDAIAKLLQTQPVYSYQFQGKRYDCGSKLGYLQATVDYALKHPEVSKEFKEYLKEIEI